MAALGRLADHADEPVRLAEVHPDRSCRRLARSRASPSTPPPDTSARMADAGRVGPAPRAAVPAGCRRPDGRPRGRRAGRHGRRPSRPRRTRCRPVSPASRSSIPATLRHPVTRQPRRRARSGRRAAGSPPVPLWRPPVDPAQAGTFGRPGGVHGSFGPRSRVRAAGWPAAPPVPEYLEDAFGRPVGNGESLGRPPAVDGAGDAPAEPGDPWRDPDASVPARAPARGHRGAAGAPAGAAVHPARGAVRAPAAAAAP